MKRIALFVLLIAMIGGAYASDELGSTAKRFAQAMTDFDYKNITKHSHPVIVDHAGGKSAYPKLLEKTYTEAGIRFENMVIEIKTGSESNCF